MQVFSVLSSLCPALGLTACLACGKASLAAEAELLAAGGIGEPAAATGRQPSWLHCAARCSRHGLGRAAAVVKC